MVARFRDYPVIIGKGLKKGLVGGRTKRIFGGGRDLFIVWLKTQKESGEEFDFHDIDKIDTHIHFGDKESLKLMIETLQKMLDEWEEVQDDKN